MDMLDRLDIIALTLLSLILFCSALVMILWARKHFEVALIILLISACIHWFTIPVDLSEGEELLEVGLATYIRIALVVLTGIVGTIVFLRSWVSSRDKVPLHLKLLGLFILYALISVSFSIDKAFTLVRSLEFLAFFGFLLGLHSWIDEPGRIDKVLLISFTILTAYVLVNALSPAIFSERTWYVYAPHRFQGLTGQPNSLGELCMVTYPFALWMFTRTSSIPGKAFTLFVLGVALAMHFMSGSRSSLAAAALCFVLWPIFTNKKLLAAAIMLVILGGGALLTLNKPASFERAESPSITSLTGREEFWRGCIVMIEEHPILGYGYAVSGKIWEDPRFQSGQTLWAGSAKVSLHNGYLDMVIGLGITGLLLWMTFLMIPSIKAFLLPASNTRACILVIFAQALFINMFESSFSGSRALGSLIFMLTLTMAARLSFLVRHMSLAPEVRFRPNGKHEPISSGVHIPVSPTRA